MTNKPSVKPDVTATGDASTKPSGQKSSRGEGAVLALDMSPDAITLLQQVPGGWQDIGKADPQSAEFSEQIEWLRVEALARTSPPQPILIWLPAEQVLIRSHAIEARGANARRSAAADHFERNDKMRREELEIAVSPPIVGDPTATCLAILAQTRREAEQYATRWGFQPGEVSCRGYEIRFGGYPRFQACDTTPVRHARTGATYAGIGLGGLVAASLTAVVMWGVLQIGKEQLRPPPPVISDVADFAAVRLADTDPSASDGLVPPVQAPTAQGLAWPTVVRDAAQPVTTHPMLWTAAFTAFDDRRAAPDLGYRSVSERLVLGHAPSRAQGSPQLANLAVPASALGDLPEMSYPQDTQPEAVVASVVVDRSVAPGDPTAEARSIETDVSAETEPPIDIDGVHVAALTSKLDLPETVPQPQPRRSAAEPDAIVPKVDSPDAAADPAATDTPQTESRTAPAIEDQVEIAVWTEASGVPMPVNRPGAEPAAVTKIVVAIEPTPEPAAQPATPELPDVAEAAPEAETELGLAASLEQSPVPLYRPDRLARQIEKAVVRVLTTTAPADPTPAPSGPVARSVRQAATEEGLPLERTSLIGIINVNSGREALIRLPNGRFRRVGRGDVLDGWEVSLIGRDALRLSRSGKNHTLLLVGR
ncbi:MAG: hypothetical protein AAF415_15250 [Pseudomonadota bacterium]